MPISNPIDPLERAFRDGVRAGNRASEQLTTVPSDTPYLTRLRYFWFKVGAGMPAVVAERGQRSIEAFVEGATVSAPVPHFALVLDNAIAQHPTDTSSDPDARMRSEIADLLESTARQIREGHDSGPIRDWLHRPVGELIINSWS